MASQPLTIAIAASILLVVVIGVDASMDRSLHLDLRDADGAWVTVANAGELGERGRYAYPAGPGGNVVANRTDSITMRVRVENGYPWAYHESYVVRVFGAEVARGALDAPSRGSGTSEFTVPVSKIVGGSGGREPVKSPDQTTTSNVYYGSVEVELDGDFLTASVNVEVPE